MKTLRLLAPPLSISLLPALLLAFAAFVGEARSQDFTPKPMPFGSPGPLLGNLQDAVAVKTSSKVTYVLNRSKEPTAEELAAYNRITASMDKATDYYNRYTSDIRLRVTANFSPGTPTADGNGNGNIRFGKTAQNQRVAMHEIAHTLGVGTSPQWARLVVNGVFTGVRATAEMRKITGDPAAIVHADRNHFWPYGLNYDNEVHSDTDLVNHCKMVSAICEDLKSAGKR